MFDTSIIKKKSKASMLEMDKLKKAAPEAIAILAPDEKEDEKKEMKKDNKEDKVAIDIAMQSYKKKKK